MHFGCCAFYDAPKAHLRIPLGTFPEKAGSTVIMPSDLIRSRIFNCKTATNKENRTLSGVQVSFNAAATAASAQIYSVRRFHYLEGELVHVPGLRQRSAKLEHISHAIPCKKGWTGEEFLNLRLVQPQSSVHLKRINTSDNVTDSKIRAVRVLNFSHSLAKEREPSAKYDHLRSGFRKHMAVNQTLGGNE